MNRSFALTCVGLSMLGICSFAGCSAQSTTGPNLNPATAESPQSADTDPLAKLSDADREVALKQAVCPVSGEKLGSMGVPPKVTVEGQELFLCCSGCEAELRKNPSEHLAKLKNAPAGDKSKTDSPKDEPKGDQPKADEPKGDQPKADEPKAEQPNAEQPKAEQPKAEPSKGDQPK